MSYPLQTKLTGKMQDSNNPPVNADSVFQITPIAGQDLDVIVSNAISQAQNYTNNHPNTWAIIYLPAGVYELNQSIDLDHNYHNIIFQGDGSSETILRFNLGSPEPNCFHIYGFEHQDSDKRYLSTNLNKNNNTLSCSENIGFSTPNWIHLSHETHAIHDPQYYYGAVGQITRLESCNGTDGTIKDNASKLYPSGESYILPITPAMNIGIENLTIERLDSEIASGGQHGINVYFEYSVNCWIKGVKFIQTCRQHSQIRYSSHILVSGCYIHNSRGFESGGYGYGVIITESTTNCLIENNIFDTLRHAMLIQAGAMCNVFSFNYSYEQLWKHAGNYVPGDEGPIIGYYGADLCCHGNYPYANLFEHNFVERIGLDRHHGANGLYNTVFRNRVTNDHDNDDSWIFVAKTEKTNVLGNVLYLYQVPKVEYHDCSPYRDIYGFIGGDGWSHRTYFFGNKDEEQAYLSDISYYYNSRPDFLSANYTWPTIGPGTTVGASVSNTIPARARFSQSTKTYIETTVNKLHNTHGVVSHNQTWNEPITLNGNLEVPTGVELKIYASVNLNSYSIISTGGSISCYTNNITPHCIRKPVNGHLYDTYALYPSLQAALADANSGDLILGEQDTYTLTQNLHISDGVILKCVDNSTIDLGTYFIKSNGTGTLSNFNDCYIQPRNIYSTEGSTRKGQYPDLQNALTNAANGKGVNFGGIHSGNFTLEKRLNLIGYNGNSCIDGNLTLNSIPSPYYVKLDNFEITGDFTANSCHSIHFEDMEMQGEVFLNYSAGYFDNCTNSGSNSVTKLYGDIVDAYDYEMAYNSISFYSRYGSDACFYRGSMGGNSRALRLYTSSVAYLEDLEFCANTQLDIYAYTDCYADAWNVEQWSDDPANSTYGNVDYPTSYTICTTLSKGTTQNLANDDQNTTNTFSKSDEGMDEFKRISKEIREISKDLHKELKKLGKFDKKAYKSKLAPHVKDLKKLVEKYPDKKSGKLALAKLKHTLFVTGDVDDVIDYAKKIKNDKRDIHVYARSLLIPCYLNNQEFDLALSLIDDLLADYPKNEYCPDWLFSKGMILKYIKKNKEAGIAIFKDIIKRWPEHPIAEWASDELNKLGKSAHPESLENHDKVPESFTLVNYPNPFNPITIIEFGLPKDGFVTVEIYDLMGRRVANPISEVRKAGVHKLVWNPINETGMHIASGIYFCRVTFGDHVLDQKLVFMR